MSTCPQCGAPVTDPHVGYEGQQLNRWARRAYCGRPCRDTAARERAAAAYEQRLAGALGPAGVAELREAASDGSTVVIEDLPPERRDGGLGPFGRAHRSGLGHS